MKSFLYSSNALKGWLFKINRFDLHQHHDIVKRYVLLSDKNQGIDLNCKPIVRIRGILAKKNLVPELPYEYLKGVR